MLWIVEAGMFERESEFERAVTEREGRVHWLDVIQEMNGRYGPTPPGEPVGFRGSFTAAERFRAARSEARPGAGGDPAAFGFSALAALAPDLMLNCERASVPLGELRERWPELRRRFGAEALFVRPDSTQKAFSGRVVTDLAAFLDRERLYLAEMPPDAPVVVAAPVKIKAEYRTVVVADRVVAASRYVAAGRKDPSPGVPAEIRAFAEAAVAEGFRPDGAFVLDVAALSGDGLRIVEANPFASSALYACDLGAVVDALNQAHG